VSAVTTSLLIGALASQGLGEQRGSAVAQVRLDGARWTVGVRYDSARKIESGAGWIGTVDAGARLGVFRLGGALVHRDGGAWTKRTWWAEPGVSAGPLEVTVRAAVAGQTEREIGVRLRLDVGRYVQMEGLALRHHDGAWGMTMAASFRLSAGGGR
jgi:hypothetical protein